MTGLENSLDQLPMNKKLQPLRFGCSCFPKHQAVSFSLMSFNWLPVIFSFGLFNFGFSLSNYVEKGSEGNKIIREFISLIAINSL